MATGNLHKSVFVRRLRLVTTTPISVFYIRFCVRTFLPIQMSVYVCYCIATFECNHLDNFICFSLYVENISGQVSCYVGTLLLYTEDLSRKFGCNKQPEVSNILPSKNQFQ